MSLVVYNTMSRHKEEFRPREEGKVFMYVCGPTVYNYIHVGNGRAYLVFDVIRRYLSYKGYEVFYVQNFTDVDDKIINRANEEGKAPEEIARHYEAAFLEDMRGLNILPPDIAPRATETIPRMIEMIRGLVDKGYAYAVDGDVFFRVESFAGYGKLSGRSLDEMRAGERVEVDERKANPMDFALWKASKPGEPAWESPWGKGRPGWHIECSAMSLHYLGMGFDIHGGGQDLVFPHHENEIAQSEAFAGSEPFVRYWLHNGFVNIQEEKMSKSLGNIILVREILKRYPADAVRLLALQTHYRNPIDFGPEALDEARRAYERLENCLFALDAFLAKPPDMTAPQRTQREVELSDSCFDFERRFEEAMDDDFNTARAIGVIFELVKELNTYLDEQELYQTPAAPMVASHGRDVLLKLCNILGLFSPAQRERESREAVVREETGPSAESLIELLLEVRAVAREGKQFATADLIRTRLRELGIRVDDLREGQRWKYVGPPA
ncbi:MAG: cysteine--tRNA ligase [Actinobacteria bacterium]|jgi:cysteinyl-tRNA synthetase|nr:MAG: cysteine--tRNA ligase [Actinomycetota bacterium]